MIDYKRYPPNWKSEIVPAILQRANNCCEYCKAANKSVYILDETKERIFLERHEKTNFYICPDGFKRMIGNCGFYHLKQIVLTIAHLDHDPENWNISYDRLRALCQRCHLLYDAQHRKQLQLNKPNLFNT